jgi:hypothetical protein
MRPTNRNRKRPCRICGKWYRPNPRLGERQRTCGDKECQRQWHGKKCQEWNRKNRSYFQETYLEKCLASCEPPDRNGSPKPHDGAVSVSLPAIPVQEVISVQQLIIIRYLLRQPIHRFQEVIKNQHAEINRNCRILPVIANSRGDSRTGVNPVT